MEKKELIYLELLTEKGPFTQLGLSKKFLISLSTINNALIPLRRMGAIEVSSRQFKIIDREKILIYWANYRNLGRDIIYKTRVNKPITRIESEMPSDGAFTAYSAFRLKYKFSPADYSEVYFYSNNIKEIQKRFPPKKGPENLFIISIPPALEKYINQNLVPDSLIFVDIWNLKEWYAKEFLNELKRKLV